MDCSADNRFVIAGGSLANAIAAAFFFLLTRITPRTKPHLKYFAWLAMTLNLISPAGYLAFSGIGGFGDWAQFIAGFRPQWAWRLGLTIIGLAAYMLFVRWSLLALRPLIGSDPHERRLHAVRLTMLSYLAGGIVECLAGAFNPQGWLLVALSAAASTFGGSSALLWSPNWLRGTSIPPGPTASPMPIPRSRPWIVAAVIITAIFISLLGPGPSGAGSRPALRSLLTARSSRAFQSRDHRERSALDLKHRPVRKYIDAPLSLCQTKVCR
jgi:hypothetical protein